jgi:hypothetical protein
MICSCLQAKGGTIRQGLAIFNGPTSVGTFWLKMGANTSLEISCDKYKNLIWHNNFYVQTTPTLQMTPTMKHNSCWINPSMQFPHHCNLQISVCQHSGSSYDILHSYILYSTLAPPEATHSSCHWHTHSIYVINMRRGTLLYELQLHSHSKLTDMYNS